MIHKRIASLSSEHSSLIFLWNIQMYLRFEYLPPSYHLDFINRYKVKQPVCNSETFITILNVTTRTFNTIYIDK